MRATDAAYENSAARYASFVIVTIEPPAKAGGFMLPLAYAS